MILQSLATGALALAKIDVARVHASEVYVAPSIAEFFDCQRWHHQTGSVFAGRWTDVEAAHAMLGMIRSAMEREFVEFLGATAAGEDKKTMAASFSQGMGQRISERLRRRKAGRMTVLAMAREFGPFRRAMQLLKRGATSTRAGAYLAGVNAGDRLRLPLRGRGASRPGATPAG
jgi:hypothetical protein